MSPIFDLRCSKCGAVFHDVLMSTKEDPATRVCGCGHQGMVKKPCRTHARFYGEGWDKPSKKGD